MLWIYEHGMTFIFIIFALAKIAIPILVVIALILLIKKLAKKS